MEESLKAISGLRTMRLDMMFGIVGGAVRGLGIRQEGSSELKDEMSIGAGR